MYVQIREGDAHWGVGGDPAEEIMPVEKKADSSPAKNAGSE
ncbi:MAG TPA: hypothetical protein VGM18_17450 [Candidatus Sulfotelmatobacter sp.]|jgi:hypothetical protein